MPAGRTGRRRRYRRKHAVHEPADVDGELDRLRPRQHHAVIERVQEAVLGDPARVSRPALVHHRNQPGRSAEADKTKLEPVSKRLPKRRPGRAVLSVRTPGEDMSLPLFSE